MGPMFTKYYFKKNRSHFFWTSPKKTTDLLVSNQQTDLKTFIPAEIDTLCSDSQHHTGQGWRLSK